MRVGMMIVSVRKVVRFVGEHLLLKQAARIFPSSHGRIGYSSRLSSTKVRWIVAVLDGGGRG